MPCPHRVDTIQQLAAPWKPGFLGGTRRLGFRPARTWARGRVDRRACLCQGGARCRGLPVAGTGPSRLEARALHPTVRRPKAHAGSRGARGRCLPVGDGGQALDRAAETLSAPRPGGDDRCGLARGLGGGGNAHPGGPVPWWDHAPRLQSVLPRPPEHRPPGYTVEASQRMTLVVRGNSGRVARQTGWSDGSGWCLKRRKR